MKTRPPLFQLAVLAVWSLCAAAGAHATTAGGAGVELIRTSHGVVHVTARDHFGLAFGVAYAYTQDNRCLLAQRIEQVNGRLAAQLGPDEIVRMMDNSHYMPALQMDAFYRHYYDINAIRAGFDAGSQAVRDLAAGYAEGVNRYLAEHPGLPPCKGETFAGKVNFTGKVTVDDVYRMWFVTASLASGEFVAPFLGILDVSALGVGAPANAAAAALRSAVAPAAGKALALQPADGFGSNAWAIGRDGVRNGRPLHFYNPHFPWDGIQRTYLIHARIPGELDVMGPALGGFPLPVSGFNRKLAWGLTFSVAPRVTFMEVAASTSDGITYSYLLDGQTRYITPRLYPIEVANEAVPRAVAVYAADDGPVLFGELLGLAPGTMLIVRDVNLDNTRLVEQMLGVAKSTSVHGLKRSLKTIQGVPWSYTTAVDAAGETLFGELSAIPNVTADLAAKCGDNPSAPWLAALGVYSLNGSRAECYWTGRLPSSQLPWVIRSDYVANSNNNYELPNLDARLTGKSPILGTANQPLALRPTLGLRMIEDRLAGIDGFGAPGFNAGLLKRMFGDKRHFAGELLVDDIVALCAAEASLKPVCDALKGWDRKVQLDSRGAHVFVGLWLALREKGLTDALFAVPNSLDEPLGTPRGLTSDPLVRAEVVKALQRVSDALGAAGVAPDAPWGDVHFVTGRHGKRFGLPGGPGTQGIFDSLHSLNVVNFDAWVHSLSGFVPAELYGSSYTHIVEFAPEGPKACAIVAQSQATEPDSPWFLDQLGRLSNGVLFRLPFKATEIRADLKSRQLLTP